MINQPELLAALNQFRTYKESLAAGRNLQKAGLSVPSTRMNEFQLTINACSRRAITALDLRDPMDLETLGELLINAGRGITEGLL